jgi:predicted MFS family arabinose efflux permease
MPRYLIWLTLGAFAIGTEGFMIAGLLPLMAADLAVSISVVGQIVTVFAIAYAAGSPVLAVVTGTYDRKVVLIVSITVFGLGNLLAAAAPNYICLMGARTLLGLAAGLFMPAASGYAAMTVAPELRGRALALIFAGQSIAVVLGVPFGTVLGQHLTWRATFLGVAALSAIAALGTAAQLVRVKNPPVASLADRIKLAGRPDILNVLVFTFVVFTGAFAIYTYIAPFDIAIAGFDVDAMPIILLLFGAGAAIGNFVGGYAGDKWNIPRFLLGVLAALISIYIGFSLCGQLHWPTAIAQPVVIAATFVWGILGFAIPSIQQLRLVRLAGPLAPIALSLNSSAIFLGISLGAALGSAVLASGSVSSLGWLGAGCEAFAFVWLAAPLRKKAGAKIGATGIKNS